MKKSRPYSYLLKVLVAIGKELRKRLPIWVLVEARQLGYSDVDLLTSYPSISATDLANAWVYAEAHTDEIELAIERNEAA